MKSKSETRQNVINLINIVGTQSNSKVKCTRTNNGLEFHSKVVSTHDNNNLTYALFDFQNLIRTLHCSSGTTDGLFLKLYPSVMFDLKHIFFNPNYIC